MDKQSEATLAENTERGGNLMSTNIYLYVRALPEWMQTKIRLDIVERLRAEGREADEIEEALDDAMCSRLVDLDDTINITKYLRYLE